MLKISLYFMGLRLDSVAYVHVFRDVDLPPRRKFGGCEMNEKSRIWNYVISCCDKVNFDASP